MSYKHDETFFAWIKNLINNSFTLLVCAIATIVFLSTVNGPHHQACIISGSVAFLSFGSLFQD
jgi:hypothetical protein